VFDKKRKRQGKEVEKKRLIKNKQLLLSSSSFPYLFPSPPSFIIGNKKEF